MDLNGRGVLVTGAAKRIGKAIAFAFARKGCRVLLHYRSSEKEALETASEIRALGASCTPFKADLTEPREIEALFTGRPELSDVGVLVNSASVFLKTPADAVTPEIWREMFALHAEAPLYLARQMAGRLARARAEGAIVNVTDRYARRPIAGCAPYCASKAALESLTRSFALEFAPHVRANAVAPGAILFPNSYNEEEMRGVLARVPLRRPGKPEDIAAACVFLAEAGYVNGCTLTVDGGASL